MFAVQAMLLGSRCMCVVWCLAWVEDPLGIQGGAALGPAPCRANSARTELSLATAAARADAAEAASSEQQAARQAGSSRQSGQQQATALALQLYYHFTYEAIARAQNALLWFDQQCCSSSSL